MAFILDCFLEIKRPVVVTGAMRSPAQLSPDGPANILAAVTCAATPSLGLAGVIAVLNDDIHSARYVTKGHTGNLAAFHSPNCGHIFRRTYGYKGGEIDLIKSGLVPSGIMGGLKAKILLTLMMMAGLTKADIERAFST